MKEKQIKKGMKVYPLIKSVNGPLAKSNEWKQAREEKRNFLTIVDIIEAPGYKMVVICANRSNAKTGDEFYAWDLREGVRPEPTLKAKKPVAKSAAKPAAKPAPKKAAPKKVVNKPTTAKANIAVAKLRSKNVKKKDPVLADKTNKGLEEAFPEAFSKE